MKRHDYRIYTILLLAFVLRLFIALTTRAVPNFSDMALYNELATAGGFPTSFPPAYPLFLRLIYAVFGAYNYTAVFVIQAVLSVFTVWLIYYVTVKIECERAGLVAAAIAAVYPNFIIYNLTTLTEAVTLLLVMLLLASLVIETDERRRSILAAAAICIGFYVRPVFLFFIPGVLPLTRKRLWFIGVIAVLLAPWFINGVVSGGGSGRGARMFYKSYNERADGISNYDLSETKLGGDDIPGGTYVREAFGFIRNNGWDTVNIIYNKSALILCRGYDQHALKEIAGGNKYILYLIYYFPIPIFLFGAAMMIRFYNRKLDILILPSVSYLLLSILLAFFKVRYRLPIEPMFVMASAILVTRIAGSETFRIRRHEYVAGGSGKKDRKSRRKKRQGKQAPRPAATRAEVAGTVKPGAGLSVREFLSRLRTDIRAHWKVLLGLTIAALSLRVLFPVFLGGVPPDEETVHIVRLALEGGIGPGDPPIYPLLIRAVFSIAGGQQPTALYIVQGMIGTATVLLLFAIAVRMFDMTTAVITAGIAVIYMNFVVYGIKVDPGFFSIFMFVLLTAIAVSDLRGTYRSAACGLIAGLGTMIQPHFLFLVPGLLLVLDRKKIFLAALALTLLPLSVRNSIVHGSFLPVYPASLFGLRAGNFFGLRDNLMIVDNLYNNAAILLSRGWDKSQRVDITGIVYMARYGYMILMTVGLAGLIRHYRREQSRLLLPILGYFLVLVLFSWFRFRHRPLIEPVFIVYAGVLLAGGCRFLVSLLRHDAGPDQDPPPDKRRA